MQTEKETTGEAEARELVITRVFDAPLDLVWKAHTEAERLGQWWGPKGCTIKVVQLDLRPGGLFHYCMDWPGGQTMWGKFVYHEVVPQERIVFVNSFSDEAGNTTRAPFSGNWPLEVFNVLTFSEADGRTTLILRGKPINASAEECATFNSMHASMQAGFGGTYDQLQAYLAKA